ncbi:zinc metalloprotease [Methylobacterium flocculans]|uniref:site-2 protease family protein n=1 Tax=Methylobacterium flocculans TaxID=2984843 RepID=UPI0021F262A9|nr:site-2 protease family protein [Methylobacterium sp. FF17]
MSGTPREAVIGLSANVLLVGLIVGVLGFGIGAGALDGSGAAFSFVMAVWVLGLCVHAFGHALAARRWGLPGTEALTLDPRRLPNRVATLLLPVVLTVLAGFGFPGGVSDAATEPDPGRRSATALAGPAMSLAFLLLLAALYALARPEAETLRAVLAVSVLFQGTALILGLMPVPGLDGYDILRPWLPNAWAWTERMARHSGFVLLGLFLVSSAFSRPLFGASLRLTAALAIDLSDVIAGYRLIRLW